MIKLHTAIAGPDFSYGGGEVVELDKNTEKRLVDSGQAEYVNKEKNAPKKKGK